MAYTPDPRPRLRAAQRFFARLHAFDLECPHCGEVYQIRRSPARTARARQHRVSEFPYWDPWTARFTCTQRECQRTYVLGIVAWPVAAVARAASQTPKDQSPTPRQVAALRKDGGGWWLPESEAQRERRPSETNLTTEPDRPEDDDDA